MDTLICMCVCHGRTASEILAPYALRYTGAFDAEFILMDDNVRPHRTRLVDEYLEDEGLKRMECPSQSPYLNPIEYLWNYLGRQVAALNPTPRSVNELEKEFIDMLGLLPIPVSDNLFDSMESRCC